MSDRTILMIGLGVLGFMVLTRRNAPVVVPGVSGPTLHDQQEYWLKMAGIQVAGQGIQALGKAASDYFSRPTTSNAIGAVVDGGFDGWNDSAGGTSDYAEYGSSVYEYFTA